MRKQDATAPRMRPSLVGGFSVPDNLRYHPGHTWALSESPNLVRIGIDDFASKLTGKIERIALPQRGQWIRQGQKVWSIVRNGVKVDMVSPIEGSVTDINEAVVNDPALATKDPYGEGWLVTVQSPDCQDQLPQPAGRRAGALVDRRVLDAAAAADAERARRPGAGRRRGHRRRRQHHARRAMDQDHPRVLPDIAAVAEPTPRSAPPAPGRFSCAWLTRD